MPGLLRVCATPIGNLGDVTLRVLDALRTADTVIAEDTRISHRLLARYEICTPLERYDEHVAEQRTPDLIARMKAGQTLALVSDAGTPGVSDPGCRLVDAAIDARIDVEVLPGPSAILTALVASGLPTHAFYFGGFLPRKEGERAALLAKVSGLEATLVFYESPRRTGHTLASIARSLPGRQAAMARELTKVHEEVVRGTIEEVAAEVSGRSELKGEVVLLVGPPTAAEKSSEVDEDALIERVERLKGTGLSSRDAIRRASEEAGVSRNQVYGIVHAKKPRGARATSS